MNTIKHTTAANNTTTDIISAVPAVMRGRHDEIITVNGQSAKIILREFGDALPEPFVSFDKAGRGDALNCDLYAYDEEQGVAVVQVRHAFRRYRNGYLNRHVDYVLVGRNEMTGQLFRHPVSAPKVRAAIRRDRLNPAAGVLAAQQWMWGVTPRQQANGIRQGDVLLVAERGEPKNITAELGTTHVVGGSHEIRAQRIVQVGNSRIWAWSPSLWHTKDQHAPVYADHEGWHSVRVARSAATWEWGTRLGD